MSNNTAIALHFQLTRNEPSDSAAQLELDHLPQPPGAVARHFIFYLRDQAIVSPVFVHVYYHNETTQGVRREDLFKFAAHAAKEFVHANPTLIQGALAAISS
jgi:hypothetical protein